MTLDEKVNMTNGHEGDCVGNTVAIERLGIPPLWYVHLLRRLNNATNVADVYTALPTGRQASVVRSSSRLSLLRLPLALLSIVA